MPTGWPPSAIAAAPPAWSIDSAAPVERLLSTLSRDARLVTVLDGHPLALSWLGSVRGHRVVPLGIESFGQSGDIPDLYRAYRLDAAAIIDAVARSIYDLPDCGRLAEPALLVHSAGPGNGPWPSNRGREPRRRRG